MGPWGSSRGQCGPGCPPPPPGNGIRAQTQKARELPGEPGPRPRVLPEGRAGDREEDRPLHSAQQGCHRRSTDVTAPAHRCHSTSPSTRRGSTSAGGPQPHGSLGTEVGYSVHTRVHRLSDAWLQPPSRGVTMRSLAFLEPGCGKRFRCTSAFNFRPMTIVPTSLYQEVKQGTCSTAASRPRLEFSPAL